MAGDHYRDVQRGDNDWFASTGFTSIAATTIRAGARLVREQTLLLSTDALKSGWHRAGVREVIHLPVSCIQRRQVLGGLINEYERAG